MAACCCLTPSGRCAAASATKRRKSGSALVSWRMNQKLAPVGAFTYEKLKLLPDDTTTGAAAVATLMRICAMCDHKLTNQLGEDQPNVFAWQPNAPCKPGRRGQRLLRRGQRLLRRPPPQRNGSGIIAR